MDDSSTLGDYCRLHFRVKCQTKQGQKVALKINEGPLVNLVTSPSAYPVWFNDKPFVLPRSSCRTSTSSSSAVFANVDSIKYKYGIVDGATFKCFETVSHDRDPTDDGLLSSTYRGVVLDALDTVVEDSIDDCVTAFPAAFSDELAPSTTGSGVFDIGLYDDLGLPIGRSGQASGKEIRQKLHSPTLKDIGVAPERLDSSSTDNASLYSDTTGTVPFFNEIVAAEGSLQFGNLQFGSASSDRSRLSDVYGSAESSPVKCINASGDSGEGPIVDMASIRRLPSQDITRAFLRPPQTADQKLTNICGTGTLNALGSEEQPSHLYIVCYHLPVKVTRLRSTPLGDADPSLDGPLFDIVWAESLISKSGDDMSVANCVSTQWIGTISGIGQLSETDRGRLTDQLASMRCIPIFLEESLDQMAYQGFCKEVMWPVFHNVDQLDHIHAAWHLHAQGNGNNRKGPDTNSDGVAEKVLEWNKKEAEYYIAYNTMNTIFANCIIDLLDQHPQSHGEVNTVWVHDYHLMMVPMLLRRAIKKATLRNDQAGFLERHPSSHDAFDDKSTSGFRRRRSSSATLLFEHGLNTLTILSEFKEVFTSTTDCVDREETDKNSTVNAAMEKRVREKLNNCKTIFFMHIPFPTSQMFRTMAMSDKLLQSMTCADVVGFHAFDHSRHFLNATKRMLGYTSATKAGGLLTLNVADREVIITMSHVSIECATIDAALAHPETHKLVEQYRQKFAPRGQKVIVGVDPCQRLSGLSMKLAGYEKFLQDNPQYLPVSTGSGSGSGGSGVGSGVGSTNTKGSQDRVRSQELYSKTSGVVLVQRCVMQKSRFADQHTTSTDMHKMVHSINTKFSAAVTNAPYKPATMVACQPPEEEGAKDLMVNGPVVDYEEFSGTPNIRQRVALWLVSDVFLLTPVREGLNLLPLEYIYARKDLPDAGCLIVSEFSTCSSLLNGSIKVNPFSALHIADAIDKALSMPLKDRMYRRQRDLTFISTHPSSLWTRQILGELSHLSSLSTTTRSKAAYSANQMTHNQVKLPDPFPHWHNIVRAYDNALELPENVCRVSSIGSRLLIFDYGGTLLYKEKSDVYIKHTLSAISGRRPSDTVMDALHRLSNDPRNLVMVVTGLTREKLGETFKGMKNITLVTSNGLVYSWGASIAGLFHSQQANNRDADQYRKFYGKAASASAMDTALPPASVPPSPLPVDASVMGTVPHPSQCNIRKDTNDAFRAASWEYLDFNIDWNDVAEIAFPIITKFTSRTNGTCKTKVTESEQRIGWSFFGADPDWGVKQAEQLTVELQGALANFDVTVQSLIQGSIEVVPKQLHKGMLVKTLLDNVCNKRGGRLPSFVIILGDDDSDDRMFEALLDTISEAGPTAEVRKMKAFTGTITRRESPAQFYYNSLTEVERLLSHLARSHSTVDCDSIA